MKARARLRNWLTGALLAVVATQALPAATQPESETGWRLRFYLASVDFDSNPAGRALRRGGDPYDIDIGAGLGVNAEYRFSERLGVDLGVLLAAGVDVVAHDVWVWGAETDVYDTITYTPMTAGLAVHLLPDRRVDLTVCPMVALVRYGALGVWTGPTGTWTTLEVDDDFAVGGALGLGVPFGERHWSFQASLTYLDSTLNGNGSGYRIDQDYDTTVFGLGFGYRF